jgi:anti-repressor protein
MELIKIYQGNFVNARELHEFLEVKTPFNKWIKRMLEYGFKENIDYLTLDKKVQRQV